MSAAAKQGVTSGVTSVGSRPITVTIDGPAGAGKSTTARMLAARLGYVYVDSGAMYRAVALRCQQEGVQADNDSAVKAVAHNTVIRFEPAPNGSEEQRVIVDGVDSTHAIRSSEISQLASSVSAIGKVREILVAKQRELGKLGGVVMEGRDIGTVVLPGAEVKVFLTASLDERARRRFLEFEQKGSQDVAFEQVRSDMAERDERDSTRAVSPLVPAADAVIIDSEEMTARQVVDTILDLCAARMVRTTSS
jgi:cytidylate kinase